MRKVRKLRCATSSSHSLSEAMVVIWKTHPPNYNTSYFLRHLDPYQIYVSRVNRNFAIYQEHKRL